MSLIVKCKMIISDFYLINKKKSKKEKEICYFFRCWHKSPEERPSMDKVVEIMTILSQFFSGHLEPVEYAPSMYVINM